MSLPVPIIDMLITNKTCRPFMANNPKYLAVHWTASEGPGADADAIARYFQRGERAASTHYAVDSEKIILCIPENEVAYSVGAAKYTDWALRNIGYSPNGKVISIEMCVNADGSFWRMYSNTAHLCAEILKRHGWGVDKLIRHFDVTGKICPAFFVGDLMARKYTGKCAADAWAGFKKDVERLMKLQEGKQYV